MSTYYSFPDCTDGGFYLTVGTLQMMNWKNTYWSQPGNQVSAGDNFRNNVWDNTCGGSTQMKTLWRSTVGTDVGGCGEPNIPIGTQSSHQRVFAWASNYVTSGYQDEATRSGLNHAGEPCMYRLSSLPPGYTNHVQIPSPASPPPVPPLSPPPEIPSSSSA